MPIFIAFYLLPTHYNFVGLKNAVNHEDDDGIVEHALTLLAFLTSL
jgi:hypothetical protein